MINFFGLPILLSFIAGILLPYIALSLSSYAYAVLFIQMVIAWFEIDPGQFKQRHFTNSELGWGLFFHLLFFPLLQWFLINSFVQEESFRQGLVLAALCPVAIVVPQFCRLYKSSVEYAYALMLSSMVFFPLMLLLVSYWGHDLFNLHGIAQIHVKPIVIDMAILLLGPVPVAFIIKKFLPGIKEKIKTKAHLFNMSAIAFLAFTYMGASVAKLNLSYTPWGEIAAIVVLMFFQDFGVYFICRIIGKNLMSKDKAQALAMSVSMKNIAISGALLLFYDPKASLASAIGFFVHGLFFNYIAVKKP